MNMISRLVASLRRRPKRPQLAFTEEASRTFRVMPTDVDGTGHMHNARYHRIVDVARRDWLECCGLDGMLTHERWSSAVAGSVMQFSRPLKLWQRYRVSTRVVGWDDRWFYLLHSFQNSLGDVVAIAGVKICVTDGEQVVSSRRITNELSPGVLPSDAPDWVQSWLSTETSLRQAADLNVLLSQIGLKRGLHARKAIGANVDPHSATSATPASGRPGNHYKSQRATYRATAGVA